MGDILSLKDNRNLIIQEMSTKASQTSVDTAITKIDNANATLASIKVKTDTITSNLFTSTHASRIDANISSRADQTTVNAIKAKTDLITSSAMSGSVKKVQRVGINITNGLYSIEVAIEAVNPQKTMINLLGMSGGSTSSSGASYESYSNIQVSLKNSTTVSAYRSGNQFSYSISCEVIEFY